MDRWNATKIASLQPQYQDRFRGFMAAAQAVARRYGATLMIWEGFRPLERQRDLFARGRAPGQEGEQRVTYTIASSTGHIWGLAIDLVLREPDGDPSWDMPRWYKTEVLPLAARFNLESLYLKTGKDPPHIEVPRSELPAVVATAAQQIRSDFPGVA